jgi:hypothetical protein
MGRRLCASALLTVSVLISFFVVFIAVVQVQVDACEDKIASSLDTPFTGGEFTFYGTYFNFQ